MTKIKKRPKKVKGVFIVADGDIRDGFQFYGPFKMWEDAEDWGNKLCESPMIIRILDPDRVDIG